MSFISWFNVKVKKNNKICHSGFNLFILRVFIGFWKQLYNHTVFFKSLKLIWAAERRIPFGLPFGFACFRSSLLLQPFSHNLITHVAHDGTRSVSDAFRPTGNAPFVEVKGGAWGERHMTHKVCCGNQFCLQPIEDGGRGYRGYKDDSVVALSNRSSGISRARHLRLRLRVNDLLLHPWSFDVLESRDNRNVIHTPARWEFSMLPALFTYGLNWT